MNRRSSPKKIPGVAFCMILVSALFLFCTAAFADVMIDASTFPDKNFRDYVSRRFDKDRSGSLSAGEIANAKSIDAGHLSISSMAGLEVFTELDYLNCSENNLTALDVSRNTKLKKLYCFTNQLESIDVSKNPQLQVLWCSQNPLTALDVSKNTLLEDLNCIHSFLKALDVSRNTRLKLLYCFDNQITSLDISKNTKLEELSCGENRLTKLNVSKNKKLVRLSCIRNKLTKLDVSKNTKLYGLEVYGNKLTALDVSNCPTLVKLIKSKSAKTIKARYGWWNSDGSGWIDWQKPHLFMDENVRLTPTPKR